MPPIDNKVKETVTTVTPGAGPARAANPKSLAQDSKQRKHSVMGSGRKLSAAATAKGEPRGERDETEFQRNRTAKARATRLANLARMKEENAKARAAGLPIPYDLKKAKPISNAVSAPASNRKQVTSSKAKPAIKAKPRLNVNPPQGNQQQTSSPDLSDPPPLLLRIPKRTKVTDNNIDDRADRADLPPPKEYMEAGFYCQDNLARSPHKLINKVLQRRETEERLKTRKSGGLRINFLDRPSFPPLPYDYGYQLFFEEEQDFVLPFDIRREAETGRLDAKKRPTAYSKLRANTFPERQRMLAGTHAVCKCDPESNCGDNCINRIMSYLCGRDCPSGDHCTNRSLARRKGPSVKVTYTGSRGFGLTANEDIREGDFVIDYRGEIISLDTFRERCRKEYAVSKNFYALAYDQDEVIDAGARGNEARFINHSCNPNLLVQRFQCLGDGLEEYEVGMWAVRDIVAGEELTYDYNFDSFGVSEGAARVQCRCGAPNCVGFLGRKSGEKSAKQIALDIEAEKAARKKVAEIKAKRFKPTARIAAAMQQTNAIAGPSAPSRSFWKSKDNEFSFEATPSSDLAQSTTGRLFGGLATGGQSIISKIKDSLTGVRRREPVPPPTMPTPESMDSAMFEIPAPVNFHLSPSSATASTSTKSNPKTKAKKARQSLPNPRLKADKDSHVTSSALRIGREISPERNFAPFTETRKAKTAAGEAQHALEQGLGEESEDDDSENGSADWLRKMAGEKPRTKDEWLEIRHDCRRGERWMSRMIAEFGMLPGPNQRGCAGIAVPQELLDAKRVEALEAGIDMTEKSIPKALTSQKRKARQTDPGPGVGQKKKKTSAAGRAKHVKLEAGQQTEAEDSDGESPKIKAKQEAIRKRNGAPMGWAYVPIAAPLVNAVDAVHINLPPRRRRAVSYAE